MRKDSGFTMMELMVVIGITAILSAIAIPSYIKWLPKHRVGSAARTVMSAMEFARSNAIKRNMLVQVDFDWGNDSLTVVNSGGNILRTRRLPGDVDLDDGGLGSPVTFNGHGFSSDPGQVTVENTKDATISRTIMLTLGGNASIQ
jgi:prepilin-type N-terminal cleavage/methylation domain-containing protein